MDKMKAIGYHAKHADKGLDILPKSAIITPH